MYVGNAFMHSTRRWGRGYVGLRDDCKFRHAVCMCVCVCVCVCVYVCMCVCAWFVCAGCMQSSTGLVSAGSAHLGHIADKDWLRNRPVLAREAQLPSAQCELRFLFWGEGDEVAGHGVCQGVEG